MAARLAKEYGFNAIALMPPDAFNVYQAAPSGGTRVPNVSDEEFRSALAGYRQAGFKIILYSSVTNCGHAPPWQTVQLARDHPDWSQRDRLGNPTTTFGAEWLCPNSPALEYALAYTQDLVRRFDPDGVLLDNNQLYRTQTGLPTCYCRHCQDDFRAYVLQRFGQDGIERFFGMSASEVGIPAEPGELFNLWIHWRKRSLAAAVERFRSGLRAVKRDIVLVANTQYQYRDWSLAADDQYRHEDAILSESRGLNSTGMSAKMQLGQALALGRPVWNYVGTFEERDLSALRPPGSIAFLMGATLAHGANPWIVAYGIVTGTAQNAPSRSVLGQYLRFYRRHATELAKSTPYTDIVSLLSPLDRDYLSQPLLPPHVAALVQRQMSPQTVLASAFGGIGGLTSGEPRGQGEPPGQLGAPAPGWPIGVRAGARHSPAGLPAWRASVPTTKVVVAEGLACMSDGEADTLAAWVRAGGALLAMRDTGSYDELGRHRAASALQSRLGLTGEPAGPVQVGMGQVIWSRDTQGILSRLLQRPHLVELDPASPQWEIVPWQLGEPPCLLVHALWHGPPEAVAEATLTLRVPPGLEPAGAEWDSPSQDAPQPMAVDFDRVTRTIRFKLPRPDVYGLAVLRMVSR